MTIHITEMPHPQILYRRGFSEWFIECGKELRVKANEASTPRSVLDNFGFSEGVEVVMNGAFLVNELLDTPLCDIFNGSDGCLTVVRRE